MHGEPDRVLARARYTMARAARDEQVVAFLHFDDFAAREFQRRVAAHDHHPLVIFLIVPEAGRAAVRAGNDALDARSGIFPEREELLRV